ncbi:Uncharacterised protein [Candidatus Anstonella stagnisolia]|nr:Uncharacterised protein [Candidatus Anstonella stagnisolia]
MNKQELIEILDAVGNSIKNNPAQFFKIEVNVIGYSSKTVGGGAGSNTIGTNISGGQLNVSASTGDIQIERIAPYVNAEINSRITKVSDLLESIKEEVKKDAPNRGLIDSCVSEIKNLIPPVIGAMLGAIISSYFPA